MKEIRIPIRTMIILFFVVIILLSISIYTSLAAFKESYEKKEIVTIEVKDISPTITTTESEFKINENGKSGVITVLPDEEQFFDLTLTNEEIINVKYELYYKSNLEENVEVGIVEEISNNTLAVGENNQVKIGIRNLSIESATVTIGTQGGYENNELKLKEGRKKLEIIKESYKDNTGANRPKIASGMIPVKYDENSDQWVKADRIEAWYNYEKQEWANVVTVNEEASTCEVDACIDEIPKKSRNGYRLAQPGTPISMDDINSMWVWIPRYKYKIPSSIGSTTDVIEPPMIDVIFEKGVSVTGVSEKEYRKAITDDGKIEGEIYYTHPAFRDINNIDADRETTNVGGWDKEITGFWMGKFETSGTVDHPTIKPNERGIVNKSLGEQFKTSLLYSGGEMNEETGIITFSGNSEYGLNSNVNSHMMKNTEYGAVAILSQSNYGKMGNTDYSEENKEIYRNNTYGSGYTGRSAGCGNCGGFSDYGTYSYDDHTCLTDESTNCTGDKENYKGTGASTTGTIYGIYDINGGNWERTMGNWNKTLSYSKLPVFPESKYYDLYTKGDGDNIIIKEEAILGDATWETTRWYSDYYVGGNFTNRPWTTRSSSMELTSTGGTFVASNSDGNSHNEINALRNSLIIEN